MCKGAPEVPSGKHNKYSEIWIKLVNICPETTLFEKFCKYEAFFDAGSHALIFLVFFALGSTKNGRNAISDLKNSQIYHI